MNVELKEELRAMIAEISEVDEIPDEKPFKELGIDSMVGVEIVATIEKKYGIKLADEELEKVSSLHSCLDLVQSKLAAKA